MTSKSDFLLIGDEIIKAKGSMNTKHFVKPSLFVEYDYEHQTSTLLWTAGVNKWFKKRFCGLHAFWETY